jgi:hypothetical protein
LPEVVVNAMIPSCVHQSNRESGFHLAVGRSRKGEGSLNESGRAALIDEEARFPRRLEQPERDLQLPD